MQKILFLFFVVTWVTNLSHYVQWSTTRVYLQIQIQIQIHSHTCSSHDYYWADLRKIMKREQPKHCFLLEFGWFFFFTSSTFSRRISFEKCCAIQDAETGMHHNVSWSSSFSSCHCRPEPSQSAAPTFLYHRLDLFHNSFRLKRLINAVLYVILYWYSEQSNG